MEEFLKIASPLGVGGILAGVIFWFYRQDHLRGEVLQERLMEVIMENARANAHLASNVQHLVELFEQQARQQVPPRRGHDA